jgi:hypothetical protein
MNLTSMLPKSTQESLLSTATSVSLLDPVSTTQNTNATLTSSSLPLSPQADGSQSDGSSVDLALPFYFDHLASDTIYGACPFDLPYNLLEPPFVAQFEPDQAFFASLFPCLRRSWLKLVWDDESISQVELPPRSTKRYAIILSYLLDC